VNNATPKFYVTLVTVRYFCITTQRLALQRNVRLTELATGTAQETALWYSFLKQSTESLATGKLYGDEDANESTVYRTV
jgi:hypothetical protein